MVSSSSLTKSSFMKMNDVYRNVTFTRLKCMTVDAEYSRHSGKVVNHVTQKSASFTNDLAPLLRLIQHSYQSELLWPHEVCQPFCFLTIHLHHASLRTNGVH